MFRSIELFRIGFLSVTVVDVIDVALVALILLRLYTILRGTIAARIFLGLIVIASLSFVSRALDMKLLSWILRTVGDVWVIGLIIIFQPELRRILLAIGRRGFFTTFQQFDVRNVVDEIVEAVDDLSLRKYGALIVVKHSTDISFIVQTGVPVEARVTKEMLVSIFNPKSPLHDGAVVINQEQIQSARVILPLTERIPRGSPMIGTRHRAGIGISEQSDVFVVMVSEERGEISYADAGEFYPEQTAESLRIALLKAYSVSRSAMSSKTRGAMQQWWEKLFSRSKK